MNNLIIKKVEFNGTSLMAVQTKEDGKIHVGVRWVCEGLGLTEGQYQNQTRKINDDVVLSKGIAKMQLPTKGGKQEVLCIELHFLPLWLAKINVNIIGNPEVQEELIDYQLHAADVLSEAFLKPLPKPRKPTSRLNPALKDALAVAELMEKIGVKPGIARAAAIRAVEKNTEVDLSEISKCLPAVEQEQIGRLNATEIAERLDIRYKTGSPDPKTVNKMLVTAGLMEKSDDGKQPYILTDKGSNIGECVPYARGGHNGYEIRWNPSIIDVLAAHNKSVQTA